MRVRSLLTALLMLPGLVGAQAPKKPTHAAAPRKTVEVAKREFGADVAGFYQHLSGEGGTLNHVKAVGPLDVRVGFPFGEYASLEPRLSFSYDSKGNGSDAAYSIAPDLNLTYGVLGGSNAAGYYATAGAGVVLSHATSNASQAQVNVGFGRREGIIRLEGFVQDVLQNKSNHLPNQFNIGVRLGLSVWS